MVGIARRHEPRRATDSPRVIAESLDVGRLLQVEYQAVFGYLPQLGEPDGQVYSVHGFEWMLGSDGDLQVIDVAGRARAVPSVYRFKDLLERGVVRESD